MTNRTDEARARIGDSTGRIADLRREIDCWCECGGCSWGGQLVDKLIAVAREEGRREERSRLAWVGNNEAMWVVRGDTMSALGPSCTLYVVDKCRTSFPSEWLWKTSPFVDERLSLDAACDVIEEQFKLKNVYRAWSQEQGLKP